MKPSFLSQASDTSRSHQNWPEQCKGKSSTHGEGFWDSVSSDDNNHQEVS